MPSWAYQKVPFDYQLSDLLVQLADLRLPLILAGCGTPLEQYGQPLAGRTLPLAHLVRMQLVPRRDLLHGAVPSQGFLGHPRFELRREPPSLRRRCLLSALAKCTLTYGLESPDHLWPRGVSTPKVGSGAPGHRILAAKDGSAPQRRARLECASNRNFQRKSLKFPSCVEKFQYNTGACNDSEGDRR